MLYTRRHWLWNRYGCGKKNPSEIKSMSQLEWNLYYTTLTTRSRCLNSLEQLFVQASIGLGHHVSCVCHKITQTLTSHRHTNHKSCNTWNRIRVHTVSSRIIYVTIFPSHSDFSAYQLSVRFIFYSSLSRSHKIFAFFFLFVVVWCQESPFSLANLLQILTRNVAI